MNNEILSEIKYEYENNFTNYEAINLFYEFQRNIPKPPIAILLILKKKV